MVTVRIPPKILTRTAVLAFVSALEEAQLPILLAGKAIAAQPDFQPQSPDWHGHFSRLADNYSLKNELPVIQGGITSYQLGGRDRSGLPISEVDGTSFDLLDEPDISWVRLEFRAPLAGVDRLNLFFSPFNCEISFTPWNIPAMAQYLDMQAIEILVEEHFATTPPEIVEESPLLPFRVFIGHGNDHQWRLLRDELRDLHDFDIEAFEGRPRAGMTISDVLEDMATHSVVAVLVLVASDELADGTWNGRQNVVHEIGFFQARLGWRNAIVVVEDGVNLFTNLDGTQQVRFPPANIQAAVGSLVAVLNERRREHLRATPRREDH